MILKACVNSNVSEFRLGELDIRFDTSKKAAAIPHPVQVMGQAYDNKQIEQETLFKDELKVKEDQLDQMLIEDPSEFEKLLAQGELIEGVNGKEEDI